MQIRLSKIQHDAINLIKIKIFFFNLSHVYVFYFLIHIFDLLTFISKFILLFLFNSLSR